MIRDIVRATLAVLVMSVAAGLLLEVRYHLAAIDIAHRSSLAGQPVAVVPQAQPQPVPGRLRSVGRAALDLADAALGVVR